MADLVRVVDSIAADPTVRLDLNDEEQWFTTSFQAPPPRLRRSVSSNAMRDGIAVSSSQYDSRVLTIAFQIISTSQEENAVEFQRLMRELDRADNFLMYQPDGALSPVFFRTFRSEVTDLVDTPAQRAMREVTVEVLAEPFALGLRETLGLFTVSQNPAAPSNGCYFDVDGVIGDVATPVIAVNTSASRPHGVLAVRSHGTPANLSFVIQAEDSAHPVTTLADTSNPGGAADATLSGAGTSNYLHTSFATTATMAERLAFAPTNGGGQPEWQGRYNVWAAVRRSDATSVIAAGLSSAPTSPTVLPLTTSRALVYLGTFSADAPARRMGYGSQALYADTSVTISAERSSGSGTVDWDCFYFLPADEGTLIVQTGTSNSALFDDVYDGYGEFACRVPTGAVPISANHKVYPAAGASGSFPQAQPGTANRFYWLAATDATTMTCPITTTDSWAVYYWPRYLFVRPSAT